MRTRSFVAVAALALLQASLLSAAQRTFVSAGSGIDANPCTRALPCRSFDVALAVTDLGGEVVALDSGGYGAFTVTQSVRIEAPPGIAASVSVFSGPGILFSAGSSSRLIVRGLRLIGLGGSGGFISTAGGSAHLETVRFSGFSDVAAAAVNGGLLTVRDSTFVGNHNGLQIGNHAAQTLGVVTNSRFYGHASVAVAASGNGDLVLADSVLSENNLAVVAAAHVAATGARVFIESCVISHNGGAILAAPGVGTRTIWVSGSTITQNDQALSGTSILSRSNNTLQSNGTEGAFTAPFVPN